MVGPFRLRQALTTVLRLRTFGPFETDLCADERKIVLFYGCMKSPRWRKVKRARLMSKKKTYQSETTITAQTDINGEKEDEIESTVS